MNPLYTLILAPVGSLILAYLFFNIFYIVGTVHTIIEDIEIREDRRPTWEDWVAMVIVYWHYPLTAAIIVLWRYLFERKNKKTLS